MSVRVRGQTKERRTYMVVGKDGDSDLEGCAIECVDWRTFEADEWPSYTSRHPV